MRHYAPAKKLQLAGQAGLPNAEFYTALQYAIALQSNFSAERASQSVTLTQAYIKKSVHN